MEKTLQATNDDTTLAALENVLPVTEPDEISQSPEHGDSETHQQRDPETAVAELTGTLDMFNSAVAEQVEAAVTEYVGFDPAIHAANPDGTPRLRTNGSYALKRGRKSGAQMPTGNPDTGADADDATATTGAAPAAVNAAASAVSNKQTAVFLVDTVTGILSRAIGPEWAAEKDEKKGLANATEQYLVAKGGLQISPEMGLLLALSAYAVPRLAVQNTQSKLSRFMGWCGDRIAVVRSRLGV